MKTSFFIFLCFIPFLLFAQDVISLKNGEDYNPEQVDAFLHDLYNANDYVISFRSKLTDNIEDKSGYFIMVKKEDKLSVYDYRKKTGRLEPLSLPVGSLALAWKTFVQNDLFTIQNEKDIPDFCPGKYKIYNSYTYEFVLLSKGMMKRLLYYDPEYYDNACYGMEERRKIINSVAVINHLLKR